MHTEATQAESRFPFEASEKNRRIVCRVSTRERSMLRHDDGFQSWVLEDPGVTRAKMVCHLSGEWDEREQWTLIAPKYIP